MSPRHQCKIKFTSKNPRWLEKPDATPLLDAGVGVFHAGKRRDIELFLKLIRIMTRYDSWKVPS